MTEQMYRRRAGEPVTLAECPVGLFESDSGELCVKSEYGVDSYIVSTGEAFWGGAKDPSQLRAVIVTPIEYEPLPAPAPDAREALEAARTWHEEQDKALSKQPRPDLWMRHQHREQIEALNAALARIGGGA